MNKILAATLGMAGLVALSAPANAAPILSTWDFTGIPTSTPDSSTATYTSGNGRVITATAYTNYESLTAYDFLPATLSDLDFDSHGIGVDNAIDTNDDLDNRGFFDFIVLELPTDEWEAVSMSFGHFGGNDDYDVWGSNTLFSGLTQLADEEDDNPLVFAPGNQFQFIYVSGSGDVGCVFFGLFCGVGLDSNDEFVLASFTGQVDEVPEPAALALLGLGLAGIGVARRRRKVA